MAKRKNRKVTTKKKQMTKVNLRAKRNYKDTVFRMLFSDKRNLLSHLSEPSKSPASIANIRLTINEGHNKDLMEQCQILGEYAQYVTKNISEQKILEWISKESR